MFNFNNVLAGMILLLCAYCFLANKVLAGNPGGAVSVLPFGQTTSVHSVIVQPSAKAVHQEPESVLSSEFQWFSSSLPERCFDDDCSLVMTEPLFRAVECIDSPSCEMTNSDPYHLTLSGIKPGAVLHLYPSPWNPEAPHQYIVLREGNASDDERYDTSDKKSPFKLMVGESRGRSLDLNPVVPVIHCDHDDAMIRYYPFHQRKETLLALVIGWLLFPTNKPPQVIVHLTQCYKNLSEPSELMSELMVGIERETLFVQSLEHSFSRQVDADNHVHDGGVMAYRKAFDPVTNKMAVQVWRNNRWQKADDEALGWVRGLQHIEELDRLFGIDTSGPYGHQTIHNGRLRAVMDRMHQEQKQRASDNRLDLSQAARVRKTPGSDTEEGASISPDQNEIDQYNVLSPESGATLDSGNLRSDPVLNDPEVSTIGDINVKPREIHLMDISSQAIFLSNKHSGGATVSKKAINRDIEAKGNECVLLSPVINSGIHRWKLNVKCDIGMSTCIGVAPAGFQMSEDYIESHEKPIYTHKQLLLWRGYEGGLFKDGVKSTSNLEPLGWSKNRDVVVECLVNVSERTLEIFKNGQSLGIAFDNLEFPLQGCVCFYSAFNKHVILEKYLCSDQDFEIVADSAPAPPPYSVNFEEVCFAPGVGWGECSRTGDGRILERDEMTKGNALCGLDTLIKAPGTYEFELFIHSDRGASTCVGVAKPLALFNTKSSDHSSLVFERPGTYLYRTHEGGQYANGEKLKVHRLPEAWIPESTIKARLVVNQARSTTATMTFFINDEMQPRPPEFNALPLPLVPVVGFYAKMKKKVQLIQYSFEPASISAFPGLNARKGASCCSDSGVNVWIRGSEMDTQQISNQCVKFGCNDPVRTIALPCRHSQYCARHLISERRVQCLFCNDLITGYWNLMQLGDQ